MKHRFIGAVIAALCLTAPALAQDHDLFVVLYMAGSSSPAGLLAMPDRPACERKAAAEQAALDADGSKEFRAKCEHRGPADMLWKLHPWLAVK